MKQSVEEAHQLEFSDLNATDEGAGIQLAPSINEVQTQEIIPPTGQAQSITSIQLARSQEANYSEHAELRSVIKDSDTNIMHHAASQKPILDSSKLHSNSQKKLSKMLTKKEREQLDILAKHTERLSESEIKQLHAQEYQQLMSSTEDFNPSAKPSAEPRKEKFRQIPQKIIALPDEVNMTLHTVHMQSPRKTQSPVLSVRSQSPAKKMLSNASTNSIGMKRQHNQESVVSLQKLLPQQFPGALDDLAGDPHGFLSKIGFTKKARSPQPGQAEMNFTPGGVADSSDQDRVNKQNYNDYLLSKQHTNNLGSRQSSIPQVQFKNSQLDIKTRHSTIQDNPNQLHLGLRASHDRSLTQIIEGIRQVNPSQNIGDLLSIRQQERDDIVDEIRADYFNKVKSVIGDFIQSKRTADTIESTEEQMKKHIIKNSYQIFRKQDRMISPSTLRRQAGGQAIRTLRPEGLEPFSNDTMPLYTGTLVNQIENEEKPNWSEVFKKPIQPLEQVVVPKDLIILKIAQKQAELAKRANRQQRERVHYSVINDSVPGDQSPTLFLPELPGSVTSRHQSQGISMGSRSARNGYDMFSSIQDPQTERQTRLRKEQALQDESIFKSNILHQSTIVGQPTAGSTQGNVTLENIGQSISFHITDLLEKSITQPREINATKANIDFYKRSIKPSDVLNQDKEVIIKNYRLRVIDAKIDLTERDRRIMKLNKGTNIYVSNSLIKPEIYRYSTKVSDAIVEVFAEMQGEDFGRPPPVLAADDFESLTYADQIELETQMAEKYYNKEDLSEMHRRITTVDNAGQSEGDEVGNISTANKEQTIDNQRDSKTATIKVRTVKDKIAIRDNSRSKNETSQGVREDQPTLVTAKKYSLDFTTQQNRRSIASSSHQHPQTVIYSSEGQTQQTALTFDQEELRAVQASEQLFDKWVRNIMTAQTAPLIEPERRLNSYGQKYPPSIKDINFQILKNEGKDRLLKAREFPLEKLTAISQITDRPYYHLLRVVTVPEVRLFHKKFLLQTIQFTDRQTKVQPSHVSPVIQNMTQTMVQTAIKFTREQLTHLDPPIINDYNLHPELFIEYDIVQKLVDQVEEYKRALTNGDELNPPQKIYGYIDYFFNDGIKRNIRVEVYDFEKASERFSCYCEDYNVSTMRSRIYILLESDHPSEQQQYMRQIVSLRTEAQQYLRVTRLIQNELLKRYSHIVLPEPVRLAIFKYINLDLNKSTKKSVHKAILQVEALYVYSILKATVSSQRDDPFIKNMMLNFKVATDSPALEIYKQPVKDKKDMKGIRSFKIQAVRTELSANATTMMNPKYIELPKRNYELTMNAIGKNQIFNSPIDVNMLVVYGGKTYQSGWSIAEIEKAVNKYPLNHEDWVNAQKVVSKHFNSLIKSKWAAQLAKSVWQAVEDDFAFNPDKQITEDEIDPFLSKLFSQIKQFQQTLLFTLFERGLRDYIRFLIGFAIRNEEIRKSAIFRHFATTRDIKLISDDPNTNEEGEGSEVNDLNLIPRHAAPMINLKAVLADVQGKNRIKKKKIVTEPVLDDIQKDMLSIVKSMHDATKEVKRVETIVFPNLTLKNPNLMQPDIGQNPRLKNVIKMISKLLENCMKGVKGQISNFQQFIVIFDKKTETIKGELQKASFALANEGEQSEKEGTQTANAEQDAPPSPGADFDQEKEVAEESEEESGEEGEGGAGNNNNAFKSEPINPELMKKEIELIRNHKWNTMFNVHEKYDFGLLVIDCRPFKQDIIDHCTLLEKYLEEVVRTEFLELMKRIQDDIQTVKGRLDERAESIDEVISLLDYIDNLKGSDNKVVDIKVDIDRMAEQMNFIFELQIQFEDAAFQEFLNIRNWPRTFNKWIQIRKEELLMQKQKLIEEMNEQLDEVLRQVLDFKLEIKDVKSKGLIKIKPKERDQRVSNLQTMFDKLRHVQPPKSAGGQSNNSGTGKAPAAAEEKKKVERIEIPDMNVFPENATFEWLAQEIGVNKHRFDPDLIDQTFQRTEKMKSEYERVQRLTILINKRQQLLGVEKTEFGELKKIQDDLKPIYELWAVASRFNTTFPQWMEGIFEAIEAGDVENTLEEWLIELKKLQKTNLIINDKKAQQKGLLMYMYDVIQYFRQYMPMIKTLRTKGLSLRHWRQIGSQLGFSIDPATVTLFKIIALDLFKEEKLKTIKNISDIAQKEFSVAQALETLDKEMKAVEFDFETAPDQITPLCKGIPDVNSRFEEFYLRANVLKTNPHMKNFFDKLLEIEKTVKSVLEILVDWTIFQRNWLYLNGIFSKSEISKQLATEVRAFTNLDSTFKATIKSIVQQPQVYKISQRENFLNGLKKMNSDSDTIRAGLNVFLEQKRDSFPRLFFISNEELIELFGKADKIIEQLIQGRPQAFLHQLYEGVEKLKVDPASKRLTAMVSKTGEIVQFKQQLETVGSTPERWLKDLETMMVLTLKHQIFNCYEDMDLDAPHVPEEVKEFKKFMATKISHERQVDPHTLADWVCKYPGQSVYTCSQIWFTQKIESIFESAEQRKVNLKEERRKLKLKLGSEYDHSDSDCYASIEYSDEEEEVKEQQDAEQVQNEEHEDEEEEEEELNEQEQEEKRANEEQRRKEEAKKAAEEIVERINVSPLDRLMRFRDRFLVNPSKHPNYHIGDITKTVKQKTEILSQMLRGRLTVYVRASVVGLITMLVYQRDLSMAMNKNETFKISDFGWQMALKMKLQGLELAAARLQGAVRHDTDMKRADIQARKDTQKIELVLDVLQFKNDYGFEYLGNCQRLVVTPLTERCQRALLVAMQFQYGGAPEGPFGTGKTETTKDLARILAKLCFIQNVSTSIEYENVLRFFKGIASSGSWVIFDEFNRLMPTILSFLSQVIINIQNAIRKKVAFVHLDDNKINLNFNCAVFITLNPGYAGRTELPMDLKNLFRSISMVVPDSFFITEILLFSAGFKNAQVLAKRVCEVQKLANILMAQASVVKLDFGLRAIKAIISIAENLKQQAQNIWESELPDLINDSSLDIIPSKQAAMIQDVQNELDPALDVNAPNLGLDLTNALRESQDPAKNKQQANQQQTNSSFNKTTQSKSLNKSFLTPTKRSQLSSRFFKMIFGEQNPEVSEPRQTQIVMAQIGMGDLFIDVDELALEELIIIKAIKDFNCSKFSRENLLSIEGIISDVFKKKENMMGQSEYSCLGDLVRASFETKRLDFNQKLEQKAFQLYEITQVKQGCIILGDVMSGKTTLIELLGDALNKASQNELKLRIAECRRQKLLEVAIKHQKDQVEEEAKEKKRVKVKEPTTGVSFQTTEPKVVSKKVKPKNETKSKNALWQDFFKKSKLTKETIDLLKEDLVIRGVDINRINPKSVNIVQLFGEVNKETYVWNEGVFTQQFRQYSKDKTSKKKWIVLDGPIDFYWVENLNSVLDDNLKLNLPNGESIAMTPGMCLLLETDSLRNVTPATISRCGLVFMNRQEVNRPKQMFNQYLKQLPPNLSESLKDMELQANWLFVDALQVFNHEKARNNLLLNDVDEHWIVHNFIMMLDSYLHGYWIEFINNNLLESEDGSQQVHLAKTAWAYGVDPKDIMPEHDEDHIDPGFIKDYFENMRLVGQIRLNAPPPKNEELRLACNDFNNKTNRSENSLKYLPKWSEAFIILSVTWAFSLVLKKPAREYLGKLLQKRIEQCQSDFATYQRLKKKQQQAKEESLKAASKVDDRSKTDDKSDKLSQLSPVKVSPTRGLSVKVDVGMSFTESNARFHRMESSKTLQQEVEIQDSGFTVEWNDSEKPIFISEFPFEQGNTVFDCYFNMENSSWFKFDMTKVTSRMLLAYGEQIPSMRLIQNIYVPTLETVKVTHVMESLITTQKPIAICGEGACGKSSMIKDFVFNQIFLFTQGTYLDHITCSHYTTSDVLKNNVERNLVPLFVRDKVDTPAESIKPQVQPEVKPGTKTPDETMEELIKTATSMSNKKETNILKPPGQDTRLIVYLEDLHMTWIDETKDQPAIESVRDFFMQKQWFSPNKKATRKIQSTNFVTCFDSVAEQKERMSLRTLEKFFIIGLNSYDLETTKGIFTQLFDLASQEWPSAVSGTIPKLAKAIMQLYDACFAHLKPTPIKVHYTFNHRECFKMVTAICKIESSFLKNEVSMMKLFYHEAMRQYADKILMKHDLQWFMSTLQTVCMENFDMNEPVASVRTTELSENESPEKAVEELKILSNKTSPLAQSPLMSQILFPIQEPSELWFSIMNDEAEGYYFQIDLKKTESLIESWLDKYNESQERQRISLILYMEISKHLLKILRAINMHDGHLITVGLKGFGLQIIMKLACFISNIHYVKMEMSQNYTDEDWRQDLRKNIVYSASEDKPLAYVCDEFRITSDKWYMDLECLVKSNICSEITRKNDVFQCLVQIAQQKKRALKALQGVSKEKAKKEEKTEIDHHYLTEMKKQIEDHPQEKADLYYSFLKRIKKNFHLIFNFTPSGANFREKMEKHKQLMICSQMIWIQNLQQEDLSAIGNIVFVQKIFKAQEEQAKQLQDVDKNAKEGKQTDASAYEIQKNLQLNQKILKAVTTIYLDTIRFAKKYQDETQHVLTYTPVFFIRTFKTYQRLLEERSRNVNEIQARYEEGLRKIKMTQDAIGKFHVELAAQTPVLQEQQRKLVAIVVDIEEETQKVKIQRETMKKQETDLTKQVEMAVMNKNECQDQLDKIVPLINEAVSSMNQISKYDVAEIRQLPHPPKAIKLVLKAVCILLEVEPIVKKNKKGDYKPSYWRAAISEKVLGDPNLPQILVSFDRNKLTTEIMGHVEDILSEADYTYENAHFASKAATGLFRWVKAIRDYYYIFQEMQPRRDALMEAEKQLIDKKDLLRGKQREIKAIDEQLEGLRLHQDQKQKIIDELKDQIDTTVTRKKRAEQLLKSLSQERQKWIVCSRMLSSKYETVQGDVVLTACYITMGSGFTAKYRKQLINRWQECIRKADITCNNIFEFQEMFGDNFKIREWHANDLPPDHYSTDNALIMTKSKRFIFFIDPDSLAQNWIRKQYKGANIRFTKMTDSNFKRTLEIGIDLGQLILVENMSDNWSVELESLVKKEISKFGNTKMINFCRRKVKYDLNFNLLLATNNSQPKLDANITNHIQTINFFVSVEALTQNILSIVVANERPDLEQSFNENTKDTFDNIKILKENEEKILKNLGVDGERILSNDKLLTCLRESKNSAEIVAQNLKKIHQTNQFLQKSRNLYARVALRAANLYFSLKNLRKINQMYRYSLTWFMNVFMQSLNKANMPTKTEVVIDDEEFKMLNSKFSADERINMLNSVFTQELIRKVIFSVYQEDRQLATYFIAVSVLSAEGLLDQEMLAFSLVGSKQVDMRIENPGVLPWMDNVMYAELDALSKIAPFSHENLIQHIKEQPEQWNNVYHGNNIIFTELPNRQLIDFGKFLSEDIVLPKTASVALTKTSQPRTGSHTAYGKPTDIQQVAQINTASGSLSGVDEDQNNQRINIVDQESRKQTAQSKRSEKSGRTRIEEGASRGGSSHAVDDKIWTEEELLADEELWRVSDSDEDSEPEVVSDRSKAKNSRNQMRNSRMASRQTSQRADQTSRKVSESVPYDPNERNKEYYEDEAAMRDEEEQMARYLVEQAPNYDGDKNRDNYKEMVRMTRQEKTQLQIREKMLRLQAELCLIRCLRPDLIKKCLHQIVGQIYDFGYNSFEQDVLSKFIDHDATNAARKTRIYNPNSEKNKNKGSALTNKKKIENNVQLLIKEAYKESKNTLPIFFLVTHSVNVFNELHQFHLKNGANSSSTKLINVQVGRGLDKKIEEAISKAVNSGDWLLIENLHLADNWLYELEIIIQKLPYEKVNSKFRLWMSSIQYDNMPAQILRQSVKIALQQPTGVKLKMERLIEKMEQETGWRKLQQRKIFKNLYMSLCYLHSVLDGRSEFGSLGWNIYSGFDASDFEISAEQIKASLTSEELKDRDSILYILKYLFANINFSGKISRKEDQRKLNAHIEDLFKSKIAFCEELPADLSSSHYGYPHIEEQDLNDWIRLNLPTADNILIYGFNRNIERYVLSNKALDTLQRLYSLNKTRKVKELGYVGLDLDLENVSIKISLAKTSQEQASHDSSNKNIVDLPEIEGESSMRSLQRKTSEYYNPDAIEDVNVDALLPLFVQIQKLIANSSLSAEIKEDSDRFDERIDSNILVQRDKTDSLVAVQAQKILTILRNLFSEKVIDMKLPQSNLKKPTHITFNIEIKCLIRLIKAISKSLEDLLQHIEGVYTKPIEIERLWHKIQNNQVPKAWRKHSFQTSCKMFADFMLEVILRVKFWQRLLKFNAQVPAVWLPAFYDPNQYINSLVQKIARAQSQATSLFKYRLEVTDFIEPTIENCPEDNNSSYIYGLYLEGASWDIERQMLVEQQTTAFFEKFPVVRIVIEKKAEDEEDKPSSEYDEIDNPQPTKQELKELQEIEKLNEEIQKQELQSPGRSKEMSGMNKSPSSNSQVSSAKKLNNKDSASAYNFRMGGDPKLDKQSSKLSSQLEASKRTLNTDSKIEMQTDNLGPQNEEIAQNNQTKTYIYRCPVFRTTLRLAAGDISSDNKPVTYIDLPTKSHPRVWVKRSVALLMETRQ